jgi:hypothetical protein
MAESAVKHSPNAICTAFVGQKTRKKGLFGDSRRQGTRQSLSSKAFWASEAAADPRRNQLFM